MEEKRREAKMAESHLCGVAVHTQRRGGNHRGKSSSSERPFPVIWLGNLNERVSANALIEGGLVRKSRPVFADLPRHDPGLTGSAQRARPSLKLEAPNWLIL